MEVFIYWKNLQITNHRLQFTNYKLQITKNTAMTTLLCKTITSQDRAST